MPLYEYYCEHCNGIFEHLRSMRQSSEAASCPLCDRDCARIMPTSFSAFTFRDGLPRRIPDDGKYWHWDGRKVKTMNTGGVPPGEHPELYRPKETSMPTRGQTEDAREVEHLKGQHLRDLTSSGVEPALGPDNQPLLSPRLGASGHVD